MDATCSGKVGDVRTIIHDESDAVRTHSFDNLA